MLNCSMHSSGKNHKRLEKYNTFKLINTIPKTTKKIKNKSLDFTLKKNLFNEIKIINCINTEAKDLSFEIEKPFWIFRGPTPELIRKKHVKESPNKSKYVNHSPKLFSMPLVESFHQELQTIPSETLAELICGNYDKDGSSFLIIDCRFPYEYNGGHIIGAINLSTKDECLTNLFNSYKKKYEENTTTTLILYSEYSTRRSQNFYHHLREQDLLLHKKLSTPLRYPEICLLEGGYNEFFENYSNLCAPKAYIKMWITEEKHDLDYYNSNLKIWNKDNKSAEYEGLSTNSPRESLPMFIF